MLLNYLWCMSISTLYCLLMSPYEYGSYCFGDCQHTIFDIIDHLKNDVLCLYEFLNAAYIRC